MAAEKAEIDVSVQLSGEKTLSTLKKDLKEAQGEALAVSRQFGETSKQAQEAAKKVAMIKDEMSDLNERVKLFDPGAKFQVFGNVVNSVAAGFTAAQGAMAVFGSESEDLQKQLVKLQGALALTQGLSAITDSWKDFQRLGGVIKTQVVSAFTTLKGALAATGIGLLVVAIGTLITNFEAIEKWLKKIIPGFESFGAVFNKIKAIAFGAFNAITEGFRVVWDVVSNIFTGDFSAAADAARNAGARIGAAYAEGFNEEVKSQAEDAARELLNARIQFQERELKVLQAGGEKRLAEARALERKILEERIQAEKVGTQARFDAEAELRAFDARAAVEREKAAEEVAKKADDQRKQNAQKALQDLQAQQNREYQLAVSRGQDVYNLKAQQLQAQLELARKYGLDIAAIENQQKDEAVARQVALNKTLQENIKVSNDTGLQNLATANAAFNQQVTQGATEGAIKIAEAEKQKQDAMALTNEVMGKLTQSNDELSGLQEGAAIALAFIVKSAEEQKVDALEATQVAMRVASKALGTQSALGKGVAIASTTIDTIQMGVAAFKGMVATFPGPWGIAAGAAAAAGVLINGFAQVKKIQATKIPGAPDSGGGNVSASVPAAPVIPRVQGDTGTMVQQLDQVNSNLQQPQRVQVVESDITNTQNRVEVIENNAKF